MIVNSKNLEDKAWRLIWDDATPVTCPLTEDDVYNDLNIVEGNGLKDLYNELISIYEADEDYYPANTLLRSINQIIKDGSDDYEDGSPNIIYLSVDGKVIINVNEDEKASYYPELAGCDLSNITCRDLIRYFIDHCDHLEERYDYDEAVEYLEDHGVSCDPCSSSYGEYACDLLDSYSDGVDEDSDEDYYSKETLDLIISRVEEAKESHEYDDDDDEEDDDDDEDDD